MNRVKVIVPATTANLGPGFDCLGLALGLYNEVTAVATSEPTLSITVTGVDASKVATDESNLVYECAQMIFDKAGKRPAGLIIEQHNQIPVGSGLGSSSTAVLAGMLLANALISEPFSREEILQFATEMEGHPDNVAPALYGGLVLGVLHEAGVHIELVEVAELTAVVVLPDFYLLTSQARAALPDLINRQDAIFNASRTPLLMRALATADYDKLALAMQDKIHQPYRIPIIPGLDAAFRSAYEAGAKGVAISGAGPSLIAFAPDNHAQIGTAVAKAFSAAGLSSRTWILNIDRNGTQIRTT